MRQNKNSDYSNYYRLVSIADSSYAAGNYNKSFTTLDTLFKRVKPLGTPEFREYDTYLRCKQRLGKNVTNSEIELLISKYGVGKNIFKADSILNSILKDKNIKDSKYKKLRNSYLNSLNLPLRQQLLKAVENDQYYRVAYDGDDKFEKMKECDAVNEKLLFELFEKGIYPNNTVVGPRVFNGEILVIETLLVHTADSIRFNYFLPKLKEFIKKGQCFTPNLYAQMVDQRRIYRGKPQIYGSFNPLEIPVEKYAEYNQNRKKADIGLNPIEFDIWWWDSLYSK